MSGAVNNETTDDDVNTTSDDSISDDDGGSSTGTKEDKPVASADVSRIVADELRKAKRKWDAELAVKLGDRTPDDVAAVLTEADARAEQEKTDLQRAQDAAEQAKQAAAVEAQKRTQLAVELALVSKLTTDRGEAGDKPTIRPDRQEMAVALIKSQGLIDPDQDLDDAVKAAIGTLRESTPEWFGSADEDSGAKNGGTPRKPVRTGKETRTTKTDAWSVGADDAKDLLARRKGSAFSTSD